MLSSGTRTGFYDEALSGYFHINWHVSFPIIPQVHGVVNDTIVFVKNILNTELNSATDNPVSSLTTFYLKEPSTQLNKVTHRACYVGLGVEMDPWWSALDQPASTF